MWYIIWRILNSTHFKIIFKCFQAIFIELQREQFLIVALLFYKKMAVLALFKTNHTGPSSTGPLGQHRISGYTGPPLCSWDEKMRCQQKEPFILGTIEQNTIIPKLAEPRQIKSRNLETTLCCKDDKKSTLIRLNLWIDYNKLWL